MASNNHNDPYSIAVDKALLKLAKEHGIALPKDDYLLVQLFLNREIICEILRLEADMLGKENEKSREYFREALVKMAKLHNEKTQSNANLIKALIATSCISMAISIAALLLHFI